MMRFILAFSGAGSFALIVFSIILPKEPTGAAIAAAAIATIVPFLVMFAFLLVSVFAAEGALRVVVGASIALMAVASIAMSIVTLCKISTML